MLLGVGHGVRRVAVHLYLNTTLIGVGWGGAAGTSDPLSAGTSEPDLAGTTDAPPP